MLRDDAMVTKLFDTLADRYKDRPAAIAGSCVPGSAMATMRRWRSSSWSTAIRTPRARIPARPGGVEAEAAEA